MNQSSLFDVSAYGTLSPRDDDEPRPRRVHRNSRAACRQHGKMLAGRRAAIVREIETRGPGTDDEIARRMGFAHKSAVQPRISELVGEGVLVEIGTVSHVVHGKRTRVRVVGLPEQRGGAA